LFDEFMKLSAQHDYTNFLYGDSKVTLRQLERTLSGRFTSDLIVGTISPPFGAISKLESERDIELINAVCPDVLWVALGCPKQEKWIARNVERLKVPIVVGVGAAFRFAAGIVSRAPECVQRVHLEWLWRLAVEPKKLWRRDLLQAPRFVAAAVSEALMIRNGE